MDIKKLFGQLDMLKTTMEGFQKEFKQLKITKEAGAGLVKVTCNGQKQLCDITIDESLFNSQSKVIMQDLILSAVNAALESVDQAVQDLVQNKAMHL